MKGVWSFIAMLLFCWIMVDCSSSELEHFAVVREDRITLVLQMALDDGDFCSRNGTEMNTDFELKIKKGTLHIFIFEGKQQVGVVERLKYYVRKDMQGDTTNYYVQGVSSIPLMPKKKYRFLVMANLTDVQCVNNDGPVFSISDLRFPDGYLPLWGVTSHTVDHSSMQNLSPVTLMYAVVKVGVKLSEELKCNGYRLSDVVLSDAATQGYVFPRRWREVDFTDSLSDDYFHPIMSSRTTPVNLYEDKLGNFFIYLPEYDNFGKNGAATIALTVIGRGNEKRYLQAVEFKKYEAGKAKPGTLHNLVRNHVYEYVVREVNVNSNRILSLECLYEDAKDK